jgi:hypothetical protein
MLNKVFFMFLLWMVPVVLAANADEFFKQAQVYYNAKDFNRAAPLLYKAAVQRHTNAQSLLGSMYLIGKGVPKDVALAIYWLKEAAKQEHAAAQSLLGAIYLVGKDAPQNLVKAAQWFQKAARLGLADAQYLLGIMYYEGKGVPRDLALAHHFFSQAATQGHADAIIARNNLSPNRKKTLPKLKGKYRLTVTTHPVDSKIRIMNIKPKYKPNIALKPGRYKIRVTHPGYISKNMQIKIKDSDLSIDVTLKKNKPRSKTF